MENGGGNSTPAQPKASRKRCPSTIASVLGKTGDRILRMEGPLPKLRIISDDPEGEDPNKNDPRSISMVAPGGLRFGSQDLTNGAITDEIPRASDESDEKGGALRFASESSQDGIPGATYYERDSSIESDLIKPTQDTGSCNRPQGRTVGRNTMGFNSYMKSVARCPDDVECSDECGYGTGCQMQCREIHGIAPDSLTSSLTLPNLSITAQTAPIVYPGLSARPGGSNNYPDMQIAGYNDSSGGPYRTLMECPDSCPGDTTTQLNFYIMLLLEVFGVLIFFAICTITFWITLAYHFIKLLVELKNADRNTQVAVAIVFGLLFLAFAICHLTSGRSTCCRHSDRSHRRNWKKGASCHTVKPEPRTPITVRVLSQIKKLMSLGCGKCNSSRPKASSPCKAKKEVVAPCRRKPKYSDCEGRAIFINSRRYAIPTEMKQPPTILLWLLDVIGRYM
ncbi:uncharacterized protein LOC110178709 [Drosophila serrata]|uniref:uncharacterized protein LOC110178709 n=1 Tax=Drosophila serrata TaxID=7274 RepID=UPI000A1D2CEC|nr:uncharacterized protein LOC110178709 [Drosophila serrata]